MDNTKIVTVRSTYKVENLTLYPLELMLVDDSGHPVYSLEKIVPGKDFSLPIEAVTKNRIRIQPDRKCSYTSVELASLIAFRRRIWVQMVSAH